MIKPNTSTGPTGVKEQNQILLVQIKDVPLYTSDKRGIPLSLNSLY